MVPRPPGPSLPLRQGRPALRFLDEAGPPDGAAHRPIQSDQAGALVLHPGDHRVHPLALPRALHEPQGRLHPVRGPGEIPGSGGVAQCVGPLRRLQRDGPRKGLRPQGGGGGPVPGVRPLGRRSRGTRAGRKEDRVGHPGGRGEISGQADADLHPARRDL